MNLIETVHGGYVHRRRVKALLNHLSELIPGGQQQLLDVGCGDGLLMARLMEVRPELTVEGIDVLVRGDSHVPVRKFDGQTIPLANDSVDFVTFIDVLHHTHDPLVLLKEAARVARRGVILKDHLRDGLFAHPTLRIMDWVGNARHGVSLPFNYQSPAEWERHYREAGLSVVEERCRLGIYPWWANWIFGRRLHVMARLRTIHKH
jgi:ubiquinone/menaquinone biosynthesis C-methylase UbiE